MNTEELRANLTDEELLTRAAAAGWEWFEEASRCGRYKMFTGWMVSDSHRINCKPDAKAQTLRGKVGTHPGFDHSIDCHVCGHPVWLVWCNDEELVKHRECFGCNFWMGLIRSFDQKSVVAGDGKAINGPRGHYCIGRKTVPHYLNGFSGNWWTILFLDGRVVETCDLWSQGNVPELFWGQLPINATLRRGRKT